MSRKNFCNLKCKSAKRKSLKHESAKKEKRNALLNVFIKIQIHGFMNETRKGKSDDK